MRSKISSFRSFIIIASKSISCCLFLLLAIIVAMPKTVWSAQKRGPIPGLEASTPYCFYYGKLDNCVISKLKKFKLVILHPGIEEPYVTPEQVSCLRAAGVIVIGYVPFGEDYVTRPGDGRGPVYYDKQNCTLIYENKGYASWYVDDQDHDGKPDQNQTWGSYFVNAGDQNWQEFVRTATIASDHFAGTDYILNDLGCDGLFIDVIETASPWTPYFYTWRGMFDSLGKTSDLYPEKYIVANRPLFACCLDSYPLACCDNDPGHCAAHQFCFCDFSSQNEARDRFRESINAFVWESYSLDRAYDDFSITRNKVMECADNADGRGFNVLVLDYDNLIQNLYSCIEDQIEEVTGLGWLDYIAPGPLDQIGYWVYDYLMRSLLIDGHFTDWACYNVCYNQSDPAGDISREDADITGISIAHDLYYLYIKFQCNGPIPPGFWPNFYQVYLDTDSDSPGYTGYRGSTADWKGEYDYLWENGTLWRYTGSGGADWSWARIESTPCAIGLEDKTGMEIAISRCATGTTDGKDVKILCHVNAYDLGSDDYAPDDPEENYYDYKLEPLIRIDGNIEDWGNACRVMP